MHLCANVLFLEDPYREGMYYPRFGVFNEPVYSTLRAEEKDSFMRLYNNFYYERHNAFWENLAKRKIDMTFRGIRMLICGEDLGMLPACVAGSSTRNVSCLSKCSRCPNAMGRNSHTSALTPTAVSPFPQPTTWHHCAFGGLKTRVAHRGSGNRCCRRKDGHHDSYRHT